MDPKKSTSIVLHFKCILYIVYTGIQSLCKYMITVYYIFQILKNVQCSNIFFTLFTLLVSAVLNVLEDHDDIY